MNLADVQKAEEIRQQIKQLERFISYKPSPFDMFFITKKPKFILGIKMRFLFWRTNHGNNIGNFIGRNQRCIETNDQRFKDTISRFRHRSW